MHSYTKLKFFTGALLVLFTSQSQAQMGSPLQPGDTAYSLEAFYINQSDADLNLGGEIGIETFGVKGGLKRGLANGHSIGIDLSASLEDYSFSSPTAFGGAAPWNEVERFGLGLNYNYQIDRMQSVFFSPSIEFAGESGADFDDAAVFGGVLGYIKVFSRELVLGFGAAVYEGLEDTTGFPVLIVSWQFAEDWRLANPFRSGPTGPAGLEVIYTGVDSWEFSVGGSYRSDRFALDDSAGYGENESVVLFLRGSRDLGEGSKLDLYLGTAIGGELSLDDLDGDTIVTEDYDPSLILAIAHTFSF